MKLLHRGKNLEVWLYRGPYGHNEVAIRRKYTEGIQWYGEGVVPLENLSKKLEPKRFRALRKEALKPI